jgi:sulfite reductase alpha subunit-like flavoprotein
MKVVSKAFQTADGLTLHIDNEGRFYVASKQHFISIIGALLIDAHSPRRSDRSMANNLLKTLKKQGVYSLDGKVKYRVTDILS